MDRLERMYLHKDKPSRSDLLFKERNSKYTTVDAIPTASRSGNSHSESSDTVDNLPEDDKEAIKRYERRTLLPLPVGAERSSEVLPSSSNCANIPKKRKIEPSNPQAVSGVPSKSKMPSPPPNTSSSSNRKEPSRVATILAPQSAYYFAQSSGGQQSLPTFSFSPPTANSSASRNPSATVIIEREVKLETLSSPEIEIIDAPVLPTLKPPEPAISQEESDRLQILFDVCAKELKVTADLREKKREIDELQRQLNMARAEERRLNKELTALVEQKTEIIDKHNERQGGQGFNFTPR